MTDRLLFIDTNIYLDFYRTRSDTAMSMLNHIEALQPILIMNYQVEMEFKKNRQKVIVDAFKSLKTPDKLHRPGVLSDDRSYHALTQDIEDASKRIKLLRERLERIILNPGRNDPVYKVMQRLFNKSGPYNLRRGMKVRHQIKRRAWRRFVLGYPPRKKEDTSIGDALNWEWIIELATQNTVDIAIVSRDSDYGIIFEDKSIINDWLKLEFKDRTSKRRNIILYKKLSDALSEFEVTITEQERSDEDELMKLLGIESKEELDALRRSVEERQTLG